MWSAPLVIFITLLVAASTTATAVDSQQQQQQQQQQESTPPLLVSSPQSCTACKLATNLYTEELLKFLTAKTDGTHKFAVDNGVVLDKTCKNDAFSGYVPVFKEVCCTYVTRKKDVKESSPITLIIFGMYLTKIHCRS